MCSALIVKTQIAVLVFNCTIIMGSIEGWLIHDCLEVCELRTVTAHRGRIESEWDVELLMKVGGMWEG